MVFPNLRTSERQTRLVSAGNYLRGLSYRIVFDQMHEVDIVLERDDGMIVSIEVKAAATVKFSDFAGLRPLAKACKTDLPSASCSMTALILCPSMTN
ncbi:DUF4143 domain-containing protein [Acidovorax sp. NCPPB 3859]|nr:hypothetical protein [Acidovorax sp. NCPPB 3859]WCM85516.1 DUF4143 domain-containing protein [Acidovorax sp. NCPPB 3859]